MIRKLLEILEKQSFAITWGGNQEAIDLAEYPDLIGELQGCEQLAVEKFAFLALF